MFSIIFSFLNLVGTILILCLSSISFGKDRIQMPNYFDQATWDLIDRINNNLDPDKNRFSTVVDGGPISFIGILENKKFNNKKLDKIKIEQTSILDDKHGVSVAGLIAGDLLKLECKVNEKFCLNREIYVSGISRKSQILGIPFHNNNTINEDNLDLLIQGIKHLEKLNQKSKMSKNIDRDMPVRFIFNFSVGTKELTESYVKYLRDKEQVYKGEFYDLYLDLIKNKAQPILSKYKIKQEDWNSFQNDISKKISTFLEEVNDNYKSLLNEFIKDNRLIFIAVGNEGKDITPQGEGLTTRRISPQSFDSVVRVAASCGDKICEFSNYNSSIVDIAAPGENIAVMSYEEKDGRKQAIATYQNGTSFSSPITAGISSLMLACNPALSIPNLKQLLLDSANSNDTFKNYIKNGKILNAKEALHRACISRMPKNIKKPSSHQKENNSHYKEDL